MWPPKTILHPTDFSDCSQYAFDLACELAALSQGKVVVLHAIIPALVNAGDIPSAVMEVEDEDEARRKLSMIQAKNPVVVLEHSMVTGTAVEVILKEAKSLNADLIVMGSHGRTGMKRLLLGSVAEHVLRRAPCPVLTARPQLKEPLIETKLSGARSKPERVSVK